MAMNAKGGLLVGIRRILETTYQGKMTVYRRSFQEKDGRLLQKDLVLLENQPCALSWGGGMRKRGNAIEQDALPEIRDEARIFASPDLEIPPGCRIVVTQYGVTRDFISCGESVVYPTHQEIVVTREGMA